MGRKPTRWVGVIAEEEVWKEGWGWFAQVRGILATVASEVGLAALFMWVWSHPHVGAAFLLLALFSACFLVGFRYVRVRAARVGNRYHCLMHDLRDETDKLLDAALTDTLTKGAFDNFNARLATNLADFYRCFMDSRDVNCEIFLADSEGPEQVYRLKARSQGADPSDNLLTVIPFDQRLVRAFSDEQRGGLGVVMVFDVAEAAEDGWLVDKLGEGKSNVKSLMVSPINGYEAGPGQAKKMLGLLVVTSQRRNLRLMYADSLRGHADMLGMLYPIIGKLKRNTQNVVQQG